VLLNQQEIHPASVSSGLATYPDEEAVQKALQAATDRVYHVPGLDIAQNLGNAKVLNVVLLGALSALLSVETVVWENVLRERVPPRFAELNLQAFHGGRSWLEERM
jgi:indolepyruvate ferredoxin oxidoreductase beta subunit